ncbi:hypothetical protein ACLB2K_046551 [Fragaria x ananassa]
MCPNLKALQIAGNKFTGSIPAEIGNATQIHELDLSSNGLVGTIPEELGGITSMVKLMLDGNKLSELKSLINLEYLDLSANKFNDSIPSFLGDFTKLHYLNLSNILFGQGGHGSVYTATSSNADTVAIKKFHLLCPNDKNFQKEFLNEIRALSEMRHRNIMKLFGFCSHRRHSFLVYEYLEKGSLATLMSTDEEAKELGWSKRVTIFKGVAHALCYMHHDCLPPIVHRDISSKNILLDSEYAACVSDFGTAKFLNPDSAIWTALAGT